MSLINDLRERREQLLSRVTAIIDTAEREARDVSAGELAQVTELRTQIDALDDHLVELASRAESRNNTLRADHSESRDGRETATARVLSEPRTYTPEAARRDGVLFTRDVIRATVDGDLDARDRLGRHMREAREHEAAGIEHRDVGTGAFAGLTVPVYLTDAVAPLMRAARPLADVCRQLPLPPSGMSVNISRITTGAAVAAQDGENVAVQETDMDDTLLTVPVRTIAGMQDVSRQAVDRGYGVDELVVADLGAAYAAELDRQLIHGTGANGQHLGLLPTVGNVDVTYTDATPTAAELYPKLADLLSQIQAATFAGATHFVMHPRRWWWLASQVGVSFPFLQMGAITTLQAGKVGGTTYDAKNSILGLPVVLDGNISVAQGAGAEDSLLGITDSECILWEQPSSPLLIRAEQAAANTLSVRLVVYGYSAFTAGRRPAANGNILGTGMTTPAFA